MVCARTHKANVTPIHSKSFPAQQRPKVKRMARATRMKENDMSGFALSGEINAPARTHNDEQLKRAGQAGKVYFITFGVFSFLF